MELLLTLMPNFYFILKINRFIYLHLIYHYQSKAPKNRRLYLESFIQSNASFSSILFSYIFRTIIQYSTLERRSSPGFLYKAKELSSKYSIEPKHCPLPAAARIPFESQQKVLQANQEFTHFMDRSSRTIWLACFPLAPAILIREYRIGSI
jgi:hypothetical protein